MSQDDAGYFRERAVEERQFARASKSRKAAAIHEELARLHEAHAANALLGPKHEPEVIVQGSRMPKGIARAF